MVDRNGKALAVGDKVYSPGDGDGVIYDLAGIRELGYRYVEAPPEGMVFVMFLGGVYARRAARDLVRKGGA
jgi:hypothetical protein